MAKITISRAMAGKYPEFKGRFGETIDSQELKNVEGQYKDVSSDDLRKKWDAASEPKAVKAPRKSKAADAGEGEEDEEGADAAKAAKTSKAAAK